MLKRKMGVPDTRPVADFLPIISIKAKDLAAEMKGLDVQSKDLKGQTKFAFFIEVMQHETIAPQLGK